jgi:hypothetical protein
MKLVGNLIEQKCRSADLKKSRRSRCERLRANYFS